MFEIRTTVTALALATGAAALVVTMRLARSDETPRSKAFIKRRSQSRASSKSWKPVSINWHFTRECNYGCHFCFHTKTEGHLMKRDDAKRGLWLLKQSGMRKLNFSGGEPFLYKRFLGELVKFCKEELHLDSVSIVSNGSLIDEAWMQKYGAFLDILAVSCDSFDPHVLRAIGRQNSQGKTDHIDQTKRVRDWCEQYDVKFKMNTVVTARNVHEDLSSQVKLLRPVRWKVFQVLPIEGENVGENATGRDARCLEIATAAFEGYISRHRRDDFVAKVLVPEDNANMRDSYLILDQRMRFLDCTSGSKVPSQSILDVGVDAALGDAGHDAERFVARGGVYEWNKARMRTLADVEDGPCLDHGRH